MKGLFVVYAMGAALAWAGSQGGAQVAGLPVFAWCILVAFAIQWLAFVPAYLGQTETFYDLTGSLTYVSVMVLAAASTANFDPRSQLLVLLVIIWAARLGYFLFTRIRQQGSDARFDHIKPDPQRFFFTWSLQGLWVAITAGAALAAITASSASPLTALDIVGMLAWLTGFVIEVVADRQKRLFRSANGSKAFINTGLWARSRHPNYFGEILLWCGVALLALPALQGWQHLTLVSPVFVYVLLTRISGIPLLERQAEQRWGDEPAYRQYRDSTPVLVPQVFG